MSPEVSHQGCASPVVSSPALLCGGDCDRPLVSVILPTYNGSKYLAEAVAACRDQTYPRWELIIVDDASTDATPEFIAKLARQDPRISSVRHQENRKLPAALNTGFARTHGTFVTWTSDDNRFRPHALARLVFHLSGHPLAGIVYSDYSIIDDQGMGIGFRKAPDPWELPYWNSMGASFLMRREVWQRTGGYREDLFLAEDYDFWLRASRRFDAVCVHEDLYEYRTHAGALSVERRRAVGETTRALLLAALDTMPWDPRSSGLAHLRIAREYSAAGNRSMAGRHFMEALRESPRALLGRHAWATAFHVLVPEEGRDMLKRMAAGMNSAVSGNRS